MPTRIAILDDDQASRTSLSDALAEAGYEPVAFTPGIGVHEVLHDVAPAAIILDVPHDPSALHCVCPRRRRGAAPGRRAGSILSHAPMQARRPGRSLGAAAAGGGRRTVAVSATRRV